MDLKTRARLVAGYRLEAKGAQDDRAFAAFQANSIRRDAGNRAGVTAALRNVRQARKNPAILESYSVDRDQAVVNAAKLRPKKVARAPRSRILSTKPKVR